jgi:hypothetical protein
MLIALARYLRAPQPRSRYIFKCAGLTLLGAIAGAFLHALAPVGPEMQDLSQMAPETLFVLAVVIAPLLETLMMWAALILIRWITRNDWIAIVAVAFIAILFHIPRPLSGLLSVGWSFLIFGIAFMAWYPRSKIDAFFITAGAHALHNLVLVGLFLAATGSD